jgi:hypothetical protein
MSKNVFVSPGVYTSEKDISFITRQVGVTALGLVGNYWSSFPANIYNKLW